jgi:hypothetical protein
MEATEAEDAAGEANALGLTAEGTVTPLPKRN